MAGPKRPQDRVALPDVWDSFVGAFRDHLEPDPKATEVGRFVAEGGTPARTSALPGDDDVTGRRPAGERRGRTRQRRDRGDHVLHEHVEPERDARRRAARAQGGRGGPRHEAVGEDVARAGLARRDRLPRPRRAHAVPRQARLRARRVRLHDLHRQLRPADRRGRRGGRRAGPERRGGALGQPELRGAGPSAGAGRLPRVAAAVRRVRARRAHRPRSHDRPDRRRAPTGRSSCATSGRAPTRCATRSPTAITEEQFTTQYGAHLGRRRALAGAADADRPRLRVGPGLDLRAGAAVLRRARRGSAGRRHRGRARAREGRRLDHDRPHLARGFDQGRLAGRHVPARARRRAGRLQLLRRPAREPRGDDARHVREHPPAQRARARAPRARSRPTCRAAR